MAFLIGVVTQKKMAFLIGDYLIKLTYSLWVALFFELDFFFHLLFSPFSSFSLDIETSIIELSD